MHHLGFAPLAAALVDDRQRRVEPLGVCPGSFHPSRVGRDDDQVFEIQTRDMVDQHRGGEEMVDRRVEKALDRGSVQIDRQDSMRPGRGQEIGHELGGDRHPRLILPILTGVAVVGQHGGNARGGGALEGIEHHQELHQVLIDGRAGRLNHEDIGPAHVLEDLTVGLAIRETPRFDRSDRYAEVLADLPGQRRVGASGKNLEIPVHTRHAEPRCVRFVRLHPADRGWGGRIRTSDPGSKVRCLTA